MKKWLTILWLSLFFLTACSSSQPKLFPLVADDVILAFGDSLTYGTGATPETSYPAYLEQITGFKVINAGVPGDQTADGLARISQQLEESTPRLVIVCLGGNDLIHKKPYAEIKENLRKIIQIIQKNGAQIVLIAEPAFSLSLSVPDFYQELGKEFHIPVESSILPTLLKESSLKSDYIHFNAEGYKAFAEGIAHFLKKQGAY